MARRSSIVRATMSKRGAVSELNDRNWDQEEEPEEVGVFVQATKDILQSRTIKKAKRRGIGDDGAVTGSKPAAFGGFAGLAKIGQPKTDEGFSSLKKLGSETVFGGKPSAFGGASSLNGNEDQKPKGQGDSKESSSYLNFLKSLNESVLAWIKQHVEENPYIILTPIFKDYEKYMDNIEADRSAASSPNSKREGSKDSKSNDNATSCPTKVSTRGTLFGSTSEKTESQEKGDKSESPMPFTFGQVATEPSLTKGFTFGTTTAANTTGGEIKFSTSASMPGSGFTFGQTKTTTATTADTPGLTFGQTKSTNADTSVFGRPSFSFGSTSNSQGSFSFKGAAATSSQGSSGAGTSQDSETKDDDEYVPPKPEVKEIVEEDALYSKRCKLYYQKDGQWVDRGVGNLHLKPVDDTKTQLLVRADTNLGNILLNIMLSASMPVSRQGKNNVFLVCVPNPPISSKPSDGVEDGTPVPMLIRVKTGEDADELLGKLEERKKLL